MSFGKPQTPLTPEQQRQRQQRLGLGLSALSDVFAKRVVPTFLKHKKHL